MTIVSDTSSQADGSGQEADGMAQPLADQDVHPVDRFMAGASPAPAGEAPDQPDLGPTTVIARSRRSRLINVWFLSLPIIVIALAVAPQIIPFNDYLTLPIVRSLVDVDEMSTRFALSGLVAWTGLTVYWLPTLIAYGRFALNRGWVLAINLFFGWTIIGWIIAIAMASSSPKNELESIKPISQ